MQLTKTGINPNYYYCSASISNKLRVPNFKDVLKFRNVFQNLLKTNARQIVHTLCYGIPFVMVYRLRQIRLDKSSKPQRSQANLVYFCVHQGRSVLGYFKQTYLTPKTFAVLFFRFLLPLSLFPLVASAACPELRLSSSSPD